MNQTELTRYRRNRLRELFAEFFKSLAADPVAGEEQQVTDEEVVK